MATWLPTSRWIGGNHLRVTCTSLIGSTQAWAAYHALRTLLPIKVQNCRAHTRHSGVQHITAAQALPASWTAPHCQHHHHPHVLRAACPSQCLSSRRAPCTAALASKVRRCRQWVTSAYKLTWGVGHRARRPVRGRSSPRHSSMSHGRPHPHCLCHLRSGMVATCQGSG